MITNARDGSALSWWQTATRRPAAESHSATNSTTLQLHHNLDSNYIPTWLRWLFLSATNYAHPSQLNVESLQFTVHPENWRCWWPVRRNKTTIALISRGSCFNTITDWLCSMLHNYNFNVTKNVYHALLTSPLNWLSTLTEKRGPTNEWTNYLFPQFKQIVGKLRDGNRSNLVTEKKGQQKQNRLMRERCGKAVSFKSANLRIARQPFEAVKTGRQAAKLRTDCARCLRVDWQKIARELFRRAFV